MLTKSLHCQDGGIEEQIASARRLWLLLDYDGTLADFAPTPEHPVAAPEVIAVLGALAAAPSTRIAVISGRRLDHLQQLVPAAGVLLAGTYGVELRLLDGQRLDRADYKAVRPPLDHLKPGWESLISGLSGFYLEDKGWALALHARFARDSEAKEVISAAKSLAAAVVEEADPPGFRLLGGHRFLEIAPALADKGEAVDYLLETLPWDEALPVYVGDDDKDERAFAATKARGGIGILIARWARARHADCRLSSPRATRRWLTRLAKKRLMRSPYVWNPNIGPG